MSHVSSRFRLLTQFLAVGILLSTNKKDMGGKGKGDGGKGGKGSRGSRNTQEMKQLFAQAKGQAEFDWSWNITPDEFQAIWKLDEGGYTWRDFIGAAGSKARWNRVWTSCPTIRSADHPFVWLAGICANGREQRR